MARRTASGLPLVPSGSLDRLHRGCTLDCLHRRPFIRVNIVWRFVLCPHLTVPLSRMPETQRLVNHAAAVVVGMRAHPSIHGPQQLRVNCGADLRAISRNSCSCHEGSVADAVSDTLSAPSYL